MTTCIMGRTPWITYVVLLAIAFGIGLTATVAASRVWAGGSSSNVAPVLQLENDSPGAPKRAPIPTTEC